MKFLIPTEPDDTHAIFVKIALENMGHHVRFLFTADQPTRLKNSIPIDNDTYQWGSKNTEHSIEKYYHQMTTVLAQNKSRYIALNNAKTYNS